MVPPNYVPGQLLQAVVNGQLIFFHPPAGAKPYDIIPIPAARETDIKVDEAKEALDVVQEDPTQCTFWFVKREVILAAPPGTPLGTFKQLKQKGALEQQVIKRGDAFQASFAKSVLVVSHRWETPTEPDPKGNQLAEVQKFLNEQKALTLVWFDYWCMPQDERTEEQRNDARQAKASTAKGMPQAYKPDTRTLAEIAEFGRMLKNVNLLYLGGTVLLLVDLQYLGRFWTQFEAWLSMRTCSKDGLLSDSDEKDYRFEIRCLYTAGRTGTGEQVKRLWLSGESGKGVSAEEAHRILDGDDIEVTNKSDKANQLPKIMKLDEQVREFYKSIGSA